MTKVFNVRYFYLATGMDGIPDTEDCGEVLAETKEEAIEKIAQKRYPSDLNTRAFFKGCLTAKEEN
jgi:hypothetical protein